MMSSPWDGEQRLSGGLGAGCSARSTTATLLADTSGDGEGLLMLLDLWGNNIPPAGTRRS
jgi:hypothetical protein